MARRGLSQRAHLKVLEGATELFAENGIDGTSIDAIAVAAGVSKATIYKHWADKDALCLEVLVHIHEPEEKAPERDSGDLRADLEEFLRYEPAPRKADLQKRIMPHLIAYSARNQEFGRAWRARVMDQPRQSLKKLLRRGMERGIFPAVLDEELGVALLIGPMMYRHVFGSGVDRAWLAKGAVDSFWRANARLEYQAASTEKSSAGAPASWSAVAKPKNRPKTKSS
jgi:AcrR family transcriptional regulator